MIYHQAGRGVWIANKLSKNEISFIPKENAGNSFVWRMESLDVWTAEINFTGRKGQPNKRFTVCNELKNKQIEQNFEKTIKVTKKLNQKEN